MEFDSIFDFLKNDNDFIQAYNMCISMEKSLIGKSYNESLILSRTAAELLMKLMIENSEFRMDFFEKDENDFYKRRKDGSYIYITFSNMIDKCKDYGLIGKKIKSRFDYIRKVGNSNVHGDELANYGIKDCQKAHKNLFLIALYVYNEITHINENIKYEYTLDNYDVRIEISPQDRENQLNNVRFEEVNKDNLISSYSSKQLFIPINSFKTIYEKYEDEILDRDKFIKDLEDFEYVSYDNLNLILKYFDESATADIIVDIRNLHDEISRNLFKTLDDLNKTDLSFEEINSLIDESKDSNQKEIYLNIKTLADDLVKNYLDEYKKEIESSPVTDFAENGRKLLRYKHYDIVEDKYGFSLKEIDENLFFDDDQKRAIEYDGEKPLIINAGPGSGKTRVIIERVAHLVKTKKKEDPNFSADSILVITFTRKATQELKERLINETDLDINDINKIRISTVHGFCRYLISQHEHLPYNYLNRHGERTLFFKKYKEKLGFEKNAFLYDHWIPKVLDKYDEYFSFKLNSNNLITFLENKMQNYTRNNQRYERYIDNFYKNNEYEYPNIKQLKKEHLSGPSYYYRWLNIAKSYNKFLDIMEKSSTCDDNTVLIKANNILEDKEFLENLKYKHILIDEFQDTDHYQKDIFDKLLEVSDSFTVVGDVDQSIYGWRGAYPENFVKFASENKDNTITLHNNYRSSRNIVEFNEELIKSSRDNLIPKELRAKKKYKAPIYQLVSSSVDEEAERIAELIANLKADGKIKYYSDVAVLFRRNKSVDNLIDPLEEREIGYYLKENNDFLDQNEVKALLTLFWYVMPYRKCELNHLGDEFLNLYGFTNEKYDSNEIFRLSESTMDLLKQTQFNFENNLKKRARIIYSSKRNKQINIKYEDVFNLEEEIKKEIFDEIKMVDIADFDKNGLIEFGITNEDDLKFFLKLRNIKIRLFEDDSSEKLSTLDLFYELLNVTSYFSEISIENNPNHVKIKKNLALFSHIIKDYESIMGEYDYEGLFIYLSRVLKGYSCFHDEFEEGFNKVHLLSMHSAKGLEYPVVIVGSIKQGICPLNYKNNELNSKPNFDLEFVEQDYYRSDELYPTPNKCLEYKEDDLDEDEKKYDAEELRTIYVATTRAKEILILSTIGDSSDEVPKFLHDLKINPNVEIRELQPYSIVNIPNIESSKVFKQTNDFPIINFENILNDYLYCEYRYDLANNTRFKVKLKNDKYVDMVLHKLLNSVHNDDEISLGKIDAKIRTIMDYHNIREFSNTYDIIRNVREYWLEYGMHYEIMENNIKLFTQLQYCDLYSVIDLVIKEDNKISIVHFVGSDESIKDIETYMICLLYYFSLLKDIDEFKDYEFNKIYLHSLKNNKRYEKVYSEEDEEDVLDYMEDVTRQIYEKKYNRRGDCENCEYFNSVCKG